jgi:amidohydrolase
MNVSDPKQTARDLLAEAQPALVGLSHWIHANPELGYEEVLASGWVAEWMTTAGFEVRRGVAGLETALAASYGPGPFHVALCAEYDALPAVGHACGHNVIAAASVGAAIALAAVSEQLGLRVTLLGTPAEEGGGGKLALIDAGELDGVHAALMVHPGPEDILEPEILGVRTLNISYTGREAHAAGFPQLGINAADALTVAQVAIGLLRQHIDPNDRVHGIVVKGGDAPNIVPAHTSAKYMVRSRTRDGLDALTARIVQCFEAGALATGAELSVTQEVAYSPMLHDPELVALYRVNAEATGRYFDPNARMVVSTDMGDVSHVVPSIHPMIGIDSRPAVNHQPEFAAAAVGPAADQAIFDGALLLAWTVIDAALNASVRTRLTGEAWVPAVGWGVEESTEPHGADEWAAASEQAAETAAASEWAASTAESSDAVPDFTWAADTWTSEASAEPEGVEVVYTETVVILEGSDAWAPEEEAVAAENAAEVAWASETPTGDAWEGDSTADDVLGSPEASMGRGEAGGSPGPQLGDDYAQWEADFAAALEVMDKPEADVEPEATADTEATAEPEARAGAEAFTEPTVSAEPEPDATPKAKRSGTRSRRSHAEPPAPARGSEQDQWEADFASALASFDREASSGSSEASDGAAEDGSGEAVEEGRRSPG